MKIFSKLVIYFLHKICISQSAFFKINTETISTAAIDKIIEKTNLLNCKLLCDASTLCQRVGYKNREDSYIKCFLLKHTFTAKEQYDKLSVFILEPFNGRLKLITTSSTQMESPLSSASTKQTTLAKIETISSTQMESFSSSTTTKPVTITKIRTTSSTRMEPSSLPTSTKQVTLSKNDTTQTYHEPDPNPNPNPDPNPITAVINKSMDTETDVVATTAAPSFSATIDTTTNLETSTIVASSSALPNSSYPKTCKEVYNLGNTSDGFYDIQLFEGVTKVKCEFFQNHAFLRFYQRGHGTNASYDNIGLHSFEDFYYFNNGATYWLGLKNLHRLTQSKSYDFVVRNYNADDIVYKNVTILGREQLYQINFIEPGHSDHFATEANGQPFERCDINENWSYFWACKTGSGSEIKTLAPNLSGINVFWNGTGQRFLKLYLRQKITNP